MTSIIIIILIILLIYVTLGRKCYEFFTMTSIISDTDGNPYMVVSKYNDKKVASMIMGEINTFANDFIEKLRDACLNNPNNKKLCNITNILSNRYNTDSLQENEPTSPNDTSYTSNKGEVISLCLREKMTGDNKFHKPSIIKFVLLHELAHIITPELNHTRLFWSNFKFLLEFCDKYNIYTSDNYSKQSVNYCSLDVTYNPFYDASLPSYFKS